MSETIEHLRTALANRYDVERCLGEGGMATVYLAHDLKHERQVALKVLRPDLAAVLGADRFVQEIKTTASLQHQNILPLFDSGEADGFLYYVMPYIEGETLRDKLNRERHLSIDEAVRTTTQVAEALDYAHRHGVIHRDIKPENILLHEGRPVVADFGIALAVSAAAGGRMTETGLSLGTPHYMSPEQATANPDLTNRSDIYSLGVVLYEMLVGDPPHTGSTVQQIVMKIVSEEAEPVTTVRKSVPPHVAAAVAMSLEKLPADRFATAADFAHALEDEHFRHGVTVGDARAPSRLRVWAVAGWGVAVILAGVLLASVGGTQSASPVRMLSLATTEEDGPSEHLVLTPDGSALVMSDAMDREGRSLFVRRLDDLARIRLPGTENAFDPAVSPDGQMVAFTGPTGLHVAPLAGGSVRTIGTDAGACCLRWADDGYIYYSSGGNIYRLHSSGGEPEPVLVDDETCVYYQPIRGGERAVFGALGPQRIEIIDVGSGRRVTLTEGVRPFVTESGYLVFVRNPGALFAARLDAESMQLTGSPVRLVEDVGRSDWDATYTLSASGDLAYWRGEERLTDQRQMVWVDRTGNMTPVDSLWTEEFESVEISPSGTRVAVTVGSGTPTEIWIKDLNGGPARRLTSYQGMNRRPVWNPDGMSLAFISDRGGKRAVYQMPVDEIGTPVPLLELQDTDIDEVFLSHDGDWLIYRTGTTPGDRDIYARRLRPDTATVVVSAQPDIDELAPELSPDGRWLAYVSSQTGRYEIWVRPFPDVDRGSRQLSVDGGVEPVWSDHGDELFFQWSTGIWSVEVGGAGDFLSGGLTRLVTNRGFARLGLNRSYAYDGRSDRFLMIQRVGQGESHNELILVQNFIEEVKARVGR